MDDLAVARALHVFGVVLWIGGVAFVTTVMLPATRRQVAPAARIASFEQAERRFANQSRATTLLTGATGFYMLYALDGWERYLMASYWWLHAMTLVWVLFTLMLFVLEPLFLHRWLARRAEAAPEATFALVQRLHWALLALSLATVLGAVAGSHGADLLG